MVAEAGEYWGAVFQTQPFRSALGTERKKTDVRVIPAAPAVYELADGTFELAGVVSWGWVCQREGQKVHGVYTYVPAFTTWIVETTNDADKSSRRSMESICCIKSRNLAQNTVEICI